MSTLYRPTLFGPSLLSRPQISAIFPRVSLISCRNSTSPSAESSPRKYDAIVIGAGPGGLTAISNLLDQGLSRVLMVDRSFTAGRINKKYREVPSNTKTATFVQWATGTEAFSKVIESTPGPNPYTKMLTFDQDSGCKLGDAINVAQMLSDGLREDSRVDSLQTRIKSLTKSGSMWTLPEHNISAQKVVLAHGAQPKRHDLVDDYPHLKELELDRCLKPSALRKAVPPGSKVGVVGSSHSAVLAMKNLYELENVKVINFIRTPLLYAEYKDGWILYDNTGLKGVAADWAKEVLEGDLDPSKLKRVNLKEEGRKEKDIYDEELKCCTHLVSAIGYSTNPVPNVEVDGKNVLPEFDSLSGKFKLKGDQPLGGLFGCGIAYPEKVTDRVGNVEASVGWFKFLKFLKRVAPEWANEKS